MGRYGQAGSEPPASEEQVESDIRGEGKIPPGGLGSVARKGLAGARFRKCGNDWTYEVIFCKCGNQRV